MFVLTMMFAVQLLTNLLVFLFTFLVEAMNDGLVNYRIGRFDFDDDGVCVVFAGGRLVGSGDVGHCRIVFTRAEFRQYFGSPSVEIMIFCFAGNDLANDLGVAPANFSHPGVSPAKK